MKGILQEGFKMHYCIESLKVENGANNWAVPMVSFCDIPLSQIKEHIGKYGSYGIGLTKNWAKKMKLSPVQYLAVGSLHAQSLRTAVNAMVPQGRTRDTVEMKPEERAVVDLIRYMKNYEGELKRNGKDAIPSYRYYDEREWRYVPPFDADFPMILPVNPSGVVDKTVLNAQVAKRRLNFDPVDISYIIVKNDAEISEFVEVIKSSKGGKYTHAETERLITRIITKKQIEDDF